MTRVEAIYQGGVFRPLGPVSLDENQRVQLHVQAAEPADVTAWLHDLQEFQRQIVAKYGVYPNSTPEIAADRKR